MYEILDVLKLIFRFADVLQFGFIFVWITGWYILYQMMRLRFLKLLIVGDIFYAAHWILRNSLHFFRHTTHTADVIVVFTTLTLYILATGFASAGACLGLRYLQEEWKNTCRESKVAQNPK